MFHLIEIEKEKRRRLAKKLETEKLNIERYKRYPLQFISERFGINPAAINWLLLDEYRNHSWDGTPNPLMKILDTLAGNKWVGVESATGTGKTFLGALIVFWFLECFDNALVVTTAPKQEQLSLHIWKEITRLFPSFGRGELSHLSIKIINKNDIRRGVGFVAGVKANEESSTRAQGFHAEHMLFILEETPGIPSPVITALQNTSTSPHNLIAAFGNPDSQFDNLHRFIQLENVEKVRISAFDHPNVVLNDPSFIPGAASVEGIKRIENRFGIENSLTLSRTRGISPAQSSESLIKLQWLLNSVDKYKIANRSGLQKIDGTYSLGVDVADSINGDKAAIAEGKGEYLYSIQDFSCSDANQLGKRDVYRIMKEKNILPENIGVDGVGVGAGTINALKELGIKVANLKGSAAPLLLNTTEEFNNLRSQMWWQMREDLRNGIIGIVNDQQLINDLSSPEWSVKNGNIVVEGKEEIKKRLGRSPNKGDAAVYWNWVRCARSRKAAVSAEIL